MPANGETCTITTDPDIPVDVQVSIMKKEEAEYDSRPPVKAQKRQRLIHGILIVKEDVRVGLLSLPNNNLSSIN